MVIEGACVPQVTGTTDTRVRRFHLEPPFKPLLPWAPEVKQDGCYLLSIDSILEYLKALLALLITLILKIHVYPHISLSLSLSQGLCP